jgi:hypothetical protein
MRAKHKVLGHFSATLRTGANGLVLERIRLWSAIFIKNPATAVALQEVFSSLDRDEGNKEEA